MTARQSPMKVALLVRLARRAFLRASSAGDAVRRYIPISVDPAIVQEQTGLSAGRPPI
ncbi:hypothetical protein PtA15_11A446 [Puccinia triticina]|uniref:Uncharacterized protein n=1 Tax=Puccinia triticina TaxID=208348 RepID=A0ABY7CXT0_9BASI|nr:uncharacterized protein PtA15_11A446 [Puccinia triticina]WAQ89755.1 hypothetical protein PtA15_11A446 [Puccinia triticina]